MLCFFLSLAKKWKKTKRVSFLHVSWPCTSLRGCQKSVMWTCAKRNMRQEWIFIFTRYLLLDAILLDKVLFSFQVSSVQLFPLSVEFIILLSLLSLLGSYYIDCTPCMWKSMEENKPIIIVPEKGKCVTSDAIFFIMRTVRDRQIWQMTFSLLSLSLPPWEIHTVRGRRRSKPPYRPYTIDVREGKKGVHDINQTWWCLGDGERREYPGQVWISKENRISCNNLEQNYFSLITLSITLVT